MCKKNLIIKYSKSSKSVNISTYSWIDCVPELVGILYAYKTKNVDTYFM